MIGVDKVNEREHSFVRQNANRVVYFDILRIVASFSIIALHLIAQNWTDASVLSDEWQVYNVFYTSSQWAVPIFVMISGALFLQRDVPIKNIFKKYILRIVTAYIFWSAIYSGYLYMRGSLTLKETVIHFINGHYHLWFLYMIVGLYLVIPICKVIVANLKLARYFLILWFVFGYLIPFIFGIGRYTFESISYTLQDSFNLMCITMPLGYVGYYILGYYLNTVSISLKQELIIYILGLIGLATVVFVTSFVSCATGEPTKTFFDSILFFAIAVFVFAKQHMCNLIKSCRVKRVLAKLSNCSFGVYLVHALVLNLTLSVIDYQTFLNNLVLSIIVVSLIVFIISYIISFILSYIPFINKFFV